MNNSAYGQPIFIPEGSSQPIALVKREATDEASLQRLVFEQPSCLPISDIDESYNPILPICEELYTGSGFIDILFISPKGQITMVETKLWRNPEARRKVVAQILDYAAQLAQWNYEDLQREVNRRLGTQGNAVYERVKQQAPEEALPEASFIDTVSRNLRKGHFLLLIVGDGMREGVQGISDFLHDHQHLHFTMAMVHLDIYDAPKVGTLLVPKTIVKTVEIGKIRVDLPEGFTLAQSNAPEQTEGIEDEDSEKNQQRKFYTEFWQEFVNELHFDDPSQKAPKPGAAQNLFVYPGRQKKAWISAYFMSSDNRVGVYFRVGNEAAGHDILHALSQEKDAIQGEFGPDILWNWDTLGDVSVRLYLDDVFDPAHRPKIKAFFQEELNNFVNIIRPRLKKYGY